MVSSSASITISFKQNTGGISRGEPEQLKTTVDGVVISDSNIMREGLPLVGETYEVAVSKMTGRGFRPQTSLPIGLHHGSAFMIIFVLA